MLPLPCASFRFRSCIFILFFFVSVNTPLRGTS